MKKRGNIITIGSFDGVHLGHSALIERTIFEAKKRRFPSMALTFNVPPRMILHPSNPLSILSSEPEKEFLLKQKGLDKVVFLDFDKKLSQTNPFYFFKYVLLQEFQARGIVVGLDFRFGANRAAGAVELVRWGEDFEIPVWVIPPVKKQGHIISSSLIRQGLTHGHFQKGLNLLGHPYLIHGAVVKGRGVGRRIGFPTANLVVETGKVLPPGVFVVRGRAFQKGGKTQFISKKAEFQAVCNIGTRPTFLKKSEIVVEVHCLSGSFPASTGTLQIELLRRLRSEKKFPSVTALQKAIGRDIAGARRYFGH